MKGSFSIENASSPERSVQTVRWCTQTNASAGAVIAKLSKAKSMVVITERDVQRELNSKDHVLDDAIKLIVRGRVANARQDLTSGIVGADSVATP